MGCVQARPSTFSPPRGVEKMKLENGYIVGKVRRVGGKPVLQKNFSTELPQGAGDSDKNVASDKKEGKLISGEHEKEGDFGVNVIQKSISKKETVEDELVNGWPKWLTDNIPKEALFGLVPKSAELYDKLDKIGQGTYSNVYKARDRDTGKIVALKKVRFDTSEPESIRFMAREIMILRHLNHPHVIKLEGLATSRMQYSLYLVFEYMQTDLSRVISRPDGRLTEPQVKCYMLQLLSGLQHCHERGILHRDIKGSNLLIDKHGTLKIADFGLANYYNPNQKRPLTSRVVTLWYRAPELLLGSTDYGFGIDLWSAGCLMAEMFAGRPIMPGRTEVEQLHRIFKLCGSPSEEYWKKLKLPTSFRPPQPYKPSLVEAFRDFPECSMGLLTVLLALDPSYRGTALSALQSEFFTTSPLACDLTGLPVVYKEEEEPNYAVQKKKNKKTRRSRTQREGRKREMYTESSKADSGSSKEDQEKSVGRDTGSSPGSTSSSVKPSVPDMINSPPAVFPGVTSHGKNSPRTEGHPNATNNILNMPPLPTTKTSTTKEGKGKINRSAPLDRRSVSTRDFRLLEKEKLPKRYVLDD
ncbi:hypothetical protein AQUCO_01400421v1 [Aquilegia coerulea]|uniref:Protein kinase domain-containing protein n=1 Tax=Aquilegia coerulea TaxID=218851 RepID=A0A2G5DWG9_AQUCA|nr:hypothetical protein AQUCO_01400421v1 [Aquilegia coerulea]PIA47816.1 hypothetical protein AQUCO_01400421v1 [Aquilegia coerulea]